MSEQYFDVLIVGAGLSGIGTASRIARECPGKSFAILDRRDRIGGTWDLFRYPGIRSDSDMLTFGYSFRPWVDTKVLADGPSIRQYIVDTAREFKIEDKIRFGRAVTAADWSTQQRTWTVTSTDAHGGEHTYRCKFLIMCSGYYNYDAGYTPDFPGIDQFQGQLIHPQQWPENLDYTGKRVIVIGSGATAVTLVPAMAGEAAHVTMLQRSPSYVFSLPAVDKVSAMLARLLPQQWVYRMGRARNVLIQRWMYRAARRWPDKVRGWLLDNVRKHMGADYDMTHFSPRYNPWDQRLCAVPDADLFDSIKSGKASVVTDHIDTFTPTGIRLKSGEELEADIIVTATGLDVQMLGGMQVAIDGQPQDFAKRMVYKAVLVQDLPNMAWVFGYINATWTLKVDIAARYICRLFRHMDKKGYDVAIPRDREGCALMDESAMDGLQSGYVQRVRERIIRQGAKLPWRVLNDYPRDRKLLLKEPIEDGILEFEREPAAATGSRQAA